MTHPRTGFIAYDCVRARYVAPEAAKHVRTELWARFVLKPNTMGPLDNTSDAFQKLSALNRAKTVHKMPIPGRDDARHIVNLRFVSIIVSE